MINYLKMTNKMTKTQKKLSLDQICNLAESVSPSDWVGSALGLGSDYESRDFSESFKISLDRYQPPWDDQPKYSICVSVPNLFG